MNQLSGAFEHTAVFAFFLLIFIIGALLASRFIGGFVRPTSKSLGSAMQAA